MKIKKFTVDEYYKDYKYATNSHLLAFKKCPYYYWQKRQGKVKEIEKDYFTYGKAVDAILSGENIEDKFYIGRTPTKSLEELQEEYKQLDKEMLERAKSGKMPLKSQATKIEKLERDIELLKELENKIKLTDTQYKNVRESVNEMRRQKLYRAFSHSGKQEIIATEIDGIKVKGMIDKLDLKNGILVDDKTTANMTTFNPEMYVQQLAWYRWLVKNVYKVDVDCYLAVVDKNATFKRSAFYHITKARLDWQEELNNEDLKIFVEAYKNKNYPSVVQQDPQNARQEVCFSCDHYPNCKYAIQSEFIIV